MDLIYLLLLTFLCDESLLLPRSLMIGLMLRDRLFILSECRHFVYYLLFCMLCFVNSAGQQRSRGKDVQAAVQLSFFEIVTGCSRDLEFEYYESAPVQGKGGSRQRVKKSKKVKVDIPAGKIIYRYSDIGSETDYTTVTLAETESQPIK